MKIKDPIRLRCSGRIVLHRQLESGAIEAYFADETEMTDAEWTEYANALRRLPIDDVVKSASDALKAFPRHANGLTPDEVKFSIPYRAAKQKYERAFAKLRAFNSK